MATEPESNCQPDEDVVFFSFADGGLLFRPGTSRLWVLNVSAASVWCLLPEVSGEGELVLRLADMFAVPVAQAREDARSVLAFFRHQGLLDDGCHQAEEGADSDRRWEIPNCGIMPALSADTQRKTFCLAGYTLQLHCEEESVAGEFFRLMAHACCPHADFPDTLLTVVPATDGAGWDVGLGLDRCYAGGGVDTLLPKLLALTFLRACDSFKHRLLFHAAVMVDNEGAVLFPGNMGSGKTTLAAALAARGYTYFSDELALFSGTSLEVEPFAAPMSIKPGSVSVLASLYPDLPQQTVHPRPDGKMVRYLPPPPQSLPGSRMRAVSKALVFPLLLSGENAGLQRIGPARALERLAMTGSSNRGLEGEDVATMIALVEQIPCYELRYDSLEQALELLDGPLLKPATGL